MTRTLLFLSGAIAFAAVAVWFANNPGTVTVDWLDYRLEAPVAALLLLVIAALVVAALLYRLWRWVLGLPGIFRLGLSSRGRRLGADAVSSGLIAAAEGDARMAGKLARAAARHLAPDAPLLLLLKARAAGLAGEVEEIQETYQAMGAREDTRLLGLLGLIREARVRGAGAEVLPLARQAAELAPGNAPVHALLFELLVGRRDWDGAEAALVKLKKLKAVSKAQGACAGSVLLSEQARQLADGDWDRALTLGLQAHKTCPGHLGAALIAARLAAPGKPERAAKIIEDAWAAEPHPGLARLYARLRPDESATERMLRIEHLTAKIPEHFESRVALVEQAIEAGLMGVARQHLNALIDGVHMTRGFELAARLARADGGRETAARLWLIQAAQAPEAGWECGRCRRRWADWALTCPHCLAIASLHWRLAPGGSRARAAALPELIEAPKRLSAPTRVPGQDIYRALAEGEALDAADRAEISEDQASPGQS